MNTFVLSLGGSIVVPGAGEVNVEFLKKFRVLILKYVKKGYRFAIVLGGGKMCRVWQDAARKTGVKSSEDLDWIGIRATQLNAEVVRTIFGKVAHKIVVCDPREKVSKFKILLGAGYKPGSSSDYDAVIRAKTLGYKTVINLSNVPYVYDKDPEKFKNAKPLKRISWKEYFELFGVKWIPGGNVPFDQIAAKTAAEAGMRVVFIGKNLKSFENCIQGKPFKGTIIGV